MWLVRWFGREDPDPRPRWLESTCASFASASGLARRLSSGDATRISVKRIEAEDTRPFAATVVARAERPRGQVVDPKKGVCPHELRPGWCAHCR